MDNIKKTIDFLLSKFESSEYMSNNPSEKSYRLEHTFRVMNIGAEIADNEGLNKEAAMIGCLLHDISYINGFNSNDDWLNHGRDAEKISRDFINSLNIEDNYKKEILYGIAIHVDDKADYESERTILSELIGEADNIDRFDSLRLVENITNARFLEMELKKKTEFVETKITNLRKLKGLIFKTQTSNSMWQNNLDKQIEFYISLKNQLQNSTALK